VQQERSTAARSPQVTREWPLIGREPEFAQITAARADPECPGIVIAAAPGVGRSRLAREAYVAAQAAGDLVYWARGTASSSAIPLGAFAALIPDEIRSDDPLELIRRSSERVRERSAGRPVWLGVDDAHLLDSASAALTLHLATAAGVFVLATVAIGQAAPDAIDVLWKDAGARRIDLAPLDGDTIAAMVKAALPGPVEELVVRRAVDASAGNPLFARELVLGALDEGRLTFDRGLWRLSRRAVSPTLASLIRTRIGTLTDAERASLELLALGEPLRLGELSDLCELDTLQALEARGMIVVDPGRVDPIVRLAQPLYGEVLRAGLPALRARALRIQLADTLASRSPLATDDALRIARWRDDAGAAIDRELLLDAALAATLAGDPDFGAELAGRAVRDGLGLPAVLLLGRAHIMAKRFADAEATLAAAEAEAAGDPDALAYIGQRIHVLHWGLGRSAQAQAFLGRAATWSSDPAWSQALEPWRLVLSDFREVGEEYDAGAVRTALADPDLDPHERRQLEVTHVFRLMVVGHVKEAHALAWSIRPTLPLRDNLDTYALGLLCVIGAESGEDWPAFTRYMREVVRDAAGVGGHQAAGLAAFALSLIAMARGRYRDAERWIAEADGHFDVQDALGSVFSLRALEVGIALFTGDLPGARARLATLRALLGRAGPLATQAAYLARAEGWGARALSDHAGAQAFRDAAAATDQPMLAARMLHEALRSGASAPEIAGELRRLTEYCDARLVAAYAAHAAALADRDGEAALAAAEDLAAIGADAYAMEAAAESARRFLAEGRTDSARRAATRARELYATEQRGSAPVIDGLDGVATELTRREAQIAALAGRGLSNQEIADQIILSVRTVETYVYRAMQKRGVTSRHEL
jgi:DNA-binding CsgD family transcriptional regulator